MGVQITQVDATRNQSTALFSLKRIFIFDNRFASGGGVYKNTTAGVQTLQAGMFVARAAGTYETASVAFSATPLTAGQTIIIAGLTYAAYYSTSSSVVFSATPLSAGQTIIIGGLTYTSTGATTRAQLAAAFASLADGATTGAGTATGTYSGALTGFSTGTVASGSTVVFTSTDKTTNNPAVQTGTGAAAAITNTNSGATTQAQLAAAFSNLLAGATTGPGTGTGSYSGALTGYTTGPALSGTVVFESTVTGPVSDLVQTGTGAAATITIVQGTAVIADGLIPVTSSNLANIIGITAMDDSVDLAINQELFINFGVKGGIDATQLVLPSGVTLDTVVGSKTLKDVLEAIGFHLDNSTVENTKYDNY